MKRVEKTPLISSIVVLMFLILGQAVVLFFNAEGPHQYAVIGYLMIAIMIPIVNAAVYNILTKKTELMRQEMKDKMDALNSASIIVVFDLDGKIIEANENFCIATGYKGSDVIGSHVRQLFSEKLKTRESQVAFWSELSNGNNITGEFEITKKSGSRIWVSTTFTPINGSKVISISQNITSERDAIAQIMRKNTYLEHAARIIRHDMYSGINVYLPRGINRIGQVLESTGKAKELHLETPIKLVKEGLKHTQQVYMGVREFTNLVKSNSTLDKRLASIKPLLIEYLKRTAYADQVKIEWLPKFAVNESLFCTAVDNLIRNGLRYNDSKKKIVTIKMLDQKTMAIIDNGRGMTKEQFIRNSQPYYRDDNQKEVGSGLGLSISIAILEEHGFTMDCQKIEEGTMITIGLK